MANCWLLITVQSLTSDIFFPILRGNHVYTCTCFRSSSLTPTVRIQPYCPAHQCPDAPRQKKLPTLPLLPRFLVFHFVDSDAQIAYSGVLVRCCAWGLWKLIQTGQPNSSVGAAWSRRKRLENKLLARFLALLMPSEGQPSHASPEQICLAVGGTKPVRFWRGRMRFACSFGA